jgi:hypothetical protein
VLYASLEIVVSLEKIAGVCSDMNRYERMGEEMKVQADQEKNAVTAISSPQLAPVRCPLFSISTWLSLALIAKFSLALTAAKFSSALMAELSLIF